MSESVLHRDAPPILIENDLERPALDDRSYRVIKLPNELEALLIHDPDTDMASASMDVNVGAFSDSDDMPGLAHAVEHVSFMGTEKYPKENDYMEYLSRYNGSSNAYTSSTSTNYHFEVAATSSNSKSASQSNGAAKSGSPFYGALDRFAQFFVAPLFLADSVDRELRAVDSEHKKNLQSDVWREAQLDKSLANPKHPYCHFNTGSFKTLHDDPLSRGVNIRNEFMKFWETHYSANRMKLVLLGRESLDEMESWVVEFFADIRNTDRAQYRWDDVPIYSEKELKKVLYVKPVKESRKLRLSFTYPDEEDLYESHPSRYFSHLIGHEGPGSILAYIKAKGWANGLSAGAYSHCPGSAIFTVDVRLTEDGLNHYQEVAQTIFQYISILNERCPQEWVFDEMKGMSEVDFRFKQKSQAVRTTNRLASVMQRPYPRKWLLSGPAVLRKFDARAIRRGLGYLHPKNCRLTVVSQEFPGEWDQREKWYGTEYKVEDMSQEFLEMLQEAAQSAQEDRPSELHLPHRNEFIPTRLEVQKKSVSEPAKAPRLIRNDENVRTWHKRDDRFWVPKANVYIYMRTPLLNLSPKTYVLSLLYEQLVKDALNEYSYDAEISGLRYTLSDIDPGLFIAVGGYDDKMSILLEKVLLSMRDLEVREDRFKITKERISRFFRNQAYDSPYGQIGQYAWWLIHADGWINEQYQVELPDVTADDIRTFFPRLLEQFHIEVLAHGNLHKEDALRLTDQVESILKPKKLPQSHWPIERTVVLPQGCDYIYEHPLKDPANVNHAIKYMLYCGDSYSRELRAKLLLLKQVAKEPAFNQLRTKEQLGYVVFSGEMLSRGFGGFYVLIQSEKSPDYLEERIELFLTKLGKMIAKFTNEEFEAHKSSIINKRLEKLKDLSQESSRFATHIRNETFDFECVYNDADAIREISKEDFLNFYNTHIDPTSPTRAKLAVHMLAQSSVKEIAKNIKPSEQKTALLELLTEFLFTADITPDSKKLSTKFANVDVAANDPVDSVVDALSAYLANVPDLEEAKVKKTLESARTLIAVSLPSMGVEVKKLGDDEEATGAREEDELKKSWPKREQIYITDVQAFKASLGLSRGPISVKELSEFEDSGPKL
ncbi:a-pheromone processing metallopeptidase Ste23 [Patellaria atrata CBS 101060]|uniref:A-pheromone processing metallopeptidase Ste23 n=1 Tax=Patellaria atrata CBS 101060 TaxID=1346257 RepID=A0A9P4SGX4_9PEZI|nr:a-pheromone processing metallopeptidase Ste23 [Patellaria atrata CBS 101060]